MKTKKRFSAETRRKLSEAMKRRWMLRKATKWPEIEAAMDGNKPSLVNLFAAAVMLSKDDGEALKQTVCDCAKGETIVAALEEEASEGTNLQKRIRKELTTFIHNAL